MAKHVTTTSGISDALKHFDSLPDSANVRQSVVQGLYGCSASTVWRRVKAGTIPAPRKYSERITTWCVRDLRHALAKACGDSHEIDSNRGGAA